MEYRKKNVQYRKSMKEVIRLYTLTSNLRGELSIIENDFEVLRSPIILVLLEMRRRIKLCDIENEVPSLYFYLNKQI